MMSVFQHRCGVVDTNDFRAWELVAIGKCAFPDSTTEVNDSLVRARWHASRECPPHLIMVIAVNEKGSNHRVIKNAGEFSVVVTRLSVNLQVPIVSGRAEIRIKFHGS